MNKSVSVIITVYNEEKCIDQCLKSLRKQDYQPMDIIVVDDGSSDNTRHLAKNNNIRLYEFPHRGTASARNFAAKKAVGQILVFVDADMTFEKDFITQLVKPINENLVKGTFSKLEYVDNWEKPFARCWNRISNQNLPDKMRILQDEEDGEDFRAILASEFLKVKGFDNIGYTDTWTLSKKLGYKPSNAPNAVYYHHNPETPKEVFESAQWIGKRSYKLGRLGSIIAVIRSCILISPFKGLTKAIRYKESSLVLFQIVYDAGITVGAIKKIICNEVSK